MNRLSSVVTGVDPTANSSQFAIFSGLQLLPPIKQGLKLPNILGNGALIKFASDGGDVEKVFDFFSGQVCKFPEDASLRLDLALLHLFSERKEEAYQIQAKALARQQLFRVVGTQGQETDTRRRVLALVAPGDFMNNAQLEFILDGTDIGLDVLYIVPGAPLPSTLPEHDVVFCAVNESDENLPILRRLAELLPHWPRPVLNAPAHISRLSRDGVAALFSSSAKICSPPVRRVDLRELRLLVAGEIPLEAVLPGARYPMIIRPVGSHCGEKLEKLGNCAELESYLGALQSGEDDFYLAAYVDYRSEDGFYRKYRIVLIGGTPFLCHMAVSDRWKIHYINVGMAENAEKRNEEKRAMETFDHDFALRHSDAFAELYERVGLDYFGIDCAELPDGRLLLFEAETAMVIHAMDSPSLYPYKVGQMAKVFAAFHALIDEASCRPLGIAG